MSYGERRRLAGSDVARGKKAGTRAGGDCEDDREKQWMESHWHSAEGSPDLENLAELAQFVHRA
jgi:hypothetical protein